MLIALISDIHGNLPALITAVAAVKARGAAMIIHAGDIVGYGPFPSEVCSYLADNNILSISGNYDIKVLNVLNYSESTISDLQKKKRELVSWTAKHIDKTAQKYLSGLPEYLQPAIPGGHNLLVVHGSPVSNDDDIYPSITAAGLKTKLDETHPDILVCGHTHIPFVKRVAGTLVINCGSTGHAVDGDPRPSYALLSVDKTAVHASIVRFKYNVEETINALKKTSLPKGLQNDFAAGTKRRYLQ